MSGNQTPTNQSLQQKGLSGLMAVLQTDLRSISQEARTKFPQIKEASERGILKLKYIEDQSSTHDKLLEALSKSEDVLKPFLLACDTKNQKMISISIGSILKLISQSVVSISTLPLILAKMTMLVDVGSEEQVQLKVLQGLLILITTLHDIHDDLLAQCLVLCFRLHSSKNSSIQHTSYATLPQIIRIIFDRVRHELQDQLPPDSTSLSGSNKGISSSPSDSSPQLQSISPNINLANNETSSSQDTVSVDPSSSSTNSPILMKKSSSAVELQNDKNGVPSSLKPCTRDAYLLLEDLCHITGGDNPTWLPPTTTIARSTGLELIEMIISVNQKLFIHLEEFKFLLKDRVCPLLIKSFKFKMDFGHTVRLMRVITQYISKYASIMVTESDVLLTKTIRMMESDNPIWMQVLALESLKTYTEDPAILRLFFRNYDKDNNAAKIFENLASCIGKYVQNLYHLDSSHYVLVNTSKNRWMDLLNRDESPIVKDNYIISICTESITGIVNAVSEINNPELSGERDEIFPQMANSCWVSILGAISMLLSKANDETLIQIVLKSLQSFTNTCGELHLSAPRDALLTCLCKTAMPTSLNSPYYGSSGEPREETEKKDKEKDETNKDDGDQQASSNGTNTLYAQPTIKNFLSLKTLLNIAHCMGGVLDETWLLVLETLEIWDKVLKTMNQTLQQDDRPNNNTNIGNSNNNISSNSVSSSPRPIGQGEIPILMTAMNSLFKSSYQLDDRSINYLFEALSKLCTNSLSKSSFVNSPTNLFSISKLVEASLSNISRIDKLWPLVSHHLIETVNFKNTYVRAFGVDSLTQIIKNALSLSSFPMTDIGADEYGGRIEGGEKTEGTNSGTPPKKFRSWDVEKLQVEFFLTIEEISFSTFVDTKERILESIHQILSVSGQILTTSWPILLSILLRVAHNNEKQYITIAFESLKLICNEFLSNLSPSCLVMVIEVVCSFVSQKSDINISLSASSGLLSDLTYFLANENALSNSKFKLEEEQQKDLLQQQQQQESDFILPPRVPGRIRLTIPSSSPYFLDKDRNLMSRMWLCAFTSMKVLCIDPRPAIRNGVIVSLFQTLATSLHLLEKDLIDLILWRILFPLVDEVKLCSEQADKERIDSDLGGGVMLLVHHSRNTAQKQWDETQVLPIGRMVIVFKTFFDTLRTLSTFTQAWEKLLNILETESKSSSKEVSMASISSLHEIVNSPITDISHPEITESVWDCLLRLSVKLTDQTNPVPKSLSVYIKVFLDFYNKTKSAMDSRQIIRVLQILYPLGLSELTNPQIHTLQLLKTFPPISEDIFPILITMLLKYVSIGINFEYSPSNCSVIFPPVVITKDLVYYSPMTEKSIDLISELFLHPTTTTTMRASIYEDILKVFGASMLTKFTKYHSNIWKISVTNLIKILPKGLLSINQDTQLLNSIKRNIIWTELIDSIQTFILHERTAQNTPNSSEKRSEEDKFDIDIINALSSEMVGFSGINVERVSIIRDRLVEILNEGSMLYNTGREKLSQSCYQNMFSICSKADPSNQESIEIAKTILPVILKRCREVLQHFVVDEKQSGQFPLSRTRLSEVSFVLKEIRDLQLQPGIYQQQIGGKSNNNIIEMGGKRPHLLELFGIISDCICTSEKEIKELLRSIFSIIGTEFLNIN